MNLINIKFEIEKIEKLVLCNSIQNNLSLNQLADAYKTLLILRNQFLSTFSGMPLDDIEELRYRIMENILNIKIDIREMVGLSCEIEKKEMERLWNKEQ